MKTGETAKHHQIFDGYKKGSFNIVIFQTLPINALSVQFNKLTLYYSHYFCTH